MAKAESLGRSKPPQPEHAVGKTGTGKKQFHGGSRRASESPTKDIIQGVNVTRKEGLGRENVSAKSSRESGGDHPHCEVVSRAATLIKKATFLVDV